MSNLRYTFWTKPRLNLWNISDGTFDGIQGDTPGEFQAEMLNKFQFELPNKSQMELLEDCRLISHLKGRVYGDIRKTYRKEDEWNN